ncbi:MAG: lipocalin-like domain-containing protein [Myxococcales bacterium]|nr:lipocalin-like domain-containing protein [Myxococcales bacterium]
MDAGQLVGAWRLVELRIAFADGRPDAHPLGDDATGMLLYTHDGYVSAMLCRGGRAELGVQGLEAAHRADDRSKAQAFDDTMSYLGRYRLEGDEVVHTVQLALLPDALGREQRRRVALEGKRLVLSYDHTPHSGVTRRYRLIWTRAEAP